MKTKNVLLTVLFFAALATASYAGSAIWSPIPTSGDWNTDLNWIPPSAPNGSGDTATFDVTTNANVSLSANTEVNAITFNLTASAYTITANSTLNLLISGTGVTNNSLNTQNFVADVDGSGNSGSITFKNSATAGSNVILSNNGSSISFGFAGGTTSFNDTSTAGSSTVNNNGAAADFTSSGSTAFNNTSTAGSAAINNNSASGLSAGGFTAFNDSATAGSAIVNNNGSTVSDAFGAENGALGFFGASTAGSSTINNNSGAVSDGAGGTTLFEDASSASNATINNNGSSIVGTTFPVGNGLTQFVGATADSAVINNNSATVSGGVGGLSVFIFSSAGSATINNAGSTVSASSFAESGGTLFFSTSTAPSATINNNASTVTGGAGGFTQFIDSGAGGSTIYNNGAGVVAGGPQAEGGFTFFGGSATGDNATITNNGATVAGGVGGAVEFHGNASAGNATIIANNGVAGAGFLAGGGIFFARNADGGTSRIEVFGNGFLDIDAIADFGGAPTTTVGSIEGDGNVFLGNNNLTVGSNNLSTTFSGVIQDGGFFFPTNTGGSLTKIGTGTLILSGANTYTGNTNVNAGVLQVDGSTVSNTFVNAGGTLAGSGTINGDVTANRRGTVSPGDAPGTLTVNNYTQMDKATLTIQIAGTNPSDCSTLNVLGNANLAGLLNPVLESSFVPSVGDQFIFMKYGSFLGSLFIFDKNIDSVSEHWVVTYLPNEAILTAAAGNVGVPDYGSSLFLLALSSIALIGWRRLASS